jgi:hypothetical protein
MSLAAVQLLLLVIAVSIFVLGLACAGMYFLNKSVDQSGR